MCVIYKYLSLPKISIRRVISIKYRLINHQNDVIKRLAAWKNCDLFIIFLYVIINWQLLSLFYSIQSGTRPRVRRYFLIFVFLFYFLRFAHFTAESRIVLTFDEFVFPTDCSNHPEQIPVNCVKLSYKINYVHFS